MEKVEGEGMEDNKISEQSWNNYKLRDDSFIVDIMSGQYRSKI